MSPGDVIQALVVGGCVVTAVFLTVIAMKAWKGDKYLCDTCQYNDPESCQKAERPQAIDCVSFRVGTAARSAEPLGRTADILSAPGTAGILPALGKVDVPSTSDQDDPS